MIADELRRELITTLSLIPAAQEWQGRNALLIRIPAIQHIDRDRSNMDVDLTIIVAVVGHITCEDGTPGLLQLIDNAVPMVRGTERADDLLKIRQKVISTRKLNPAEIGQVDLFDLYQPVMRCLSYLGPEGGVTGFVLPSATAPLLENFGESLKHRGHPMLWSRGGFAAIGVQTVNAVGNPVSNASRNLTNLKRPLERQHVLWAACVENPADCATLWQTARAAFDGIQKHMIMILGCESESIPRGMVELPRPVFRSSDVEKWLKEVGESERWNDGLLKQSASAIIAGDAEPFLPDVIYGRLKRCRKLLDVHAGNHDELCEALRYMELIERGGYAAD